MCTVHNIATRTHTHSRTMMKSAREGYNMMVEAIIRPPRAEYSEYDMGPDTFAIGGDKRVQRTDLEVRNVRGQVLQCSWFEPVTSTRPRERLPCVIYMHGNSGCRLDAQEAVLALTPYDITVFCFDFSGSGKSEGDYVSLGFFEKDDVAAVVKYLRDSETVSRIALWGRSMGAATAIMYGETDPSIAGMVCDSPFASLEVLSAELADMSEMRIPGMVQKVGQKLIKKSVRKKAGFDIGKCEPIKYVDRCFIPVLFVHGESDTFIAPHHSHDLAAKYGGDKNVIIVDGDHNSARPDFCMDSILFFFTNTLLVDEDAVSKDIDVSQYGQRNPFSGGSSAGAKSAFARAIEQSLDYVGDGQDYVYNPADFGDDATPDVQAVDDAAAREEAELAMAIALSLGQTPATDE